MAKTKDLVPIRDTAGREYQSRRAWAQKHIASGDAYWDGGRCVFYTIDELAERRLRASAPVAVVPRLHRARLYVELRACEPTPDRSGAPWITYPYPDARARSSSLRERFPDLAKVGAGMR